MLSNVLSFIYHFYFPCGAQRILSKTKAATPALRDTFSMNVLNITKHNKQLAENSGMTQQQSHLSERPGKKMKKKKSALTKLLKQIE